MLKLFDDLDDLTREPFAAAKREIDTALSLNYGIDVDELRPWHYHDPFFQESPAIFTRRTSIRAYRVGRHPEACAASFTPASACRSTT